MSRIVALVLMGMLFLPGCATSPPKSASDICEIFRDKQGWYEAALASEQRWDVPIPVQMAIVRHESAFVSDALPPRTWFLFIPTGRVSTAYGYSQALDGTWERYLRTTGRWSASRDDFDDAIDFVGWYVNQGVRELRIPADDAYRQYLIYHEGAGGYSRGSYRQKPWLMDVAHNVSRTARRYGVQLDGCRGEFDDDYARY